MNKIRVLLLCALALCLCAACADSEMSKNESTSKEAGASSVFAETPDGSEPSSAETSSAEESGTAPDERYSLLSLLEGVECTEGLGYLPDAEPGDRIPLDRMPKADQALVGTSVRICLSRFEREGIAFHYVYDSETGSERLSLVAKHFLVVCETSFGGIGRLYDAIDSAEPFEATIVSLTAIMLEEQAFALEAVVGGNAFSEQGCLHPENSAEGGECFGALGMLTDGGQPVQVIYAVSGEPSGAMQNAKDVYAELYERYELT